MLYSVATVCIYICDRACENRACGHKLLPVILQVISGSAKCRNGINWGARQVEKTFETDFASFSNCHTVTRIVLEFISFYLYAS